MIRVHKEICINNIWEHESVFTLRDVDAEQLISILGRYCIGTTLLPDERFGGTVTALDFHYSEKHIGEIYLLRADDIARLRKVWSSYFGDFDKQIGYFLWDTGDVAAYPDVVAENASKWNLTNYRMILWDQ